MKMVLEKTFHPLIIPRVGFHEKRPNKKKTTQHDGNKIRSRPKGWQEFVCAADQAPLLEWLSEDGPIMHRFGALGIGTDATGSPDQLLKTDLQFRK
jgi:hypothetical protein